MVFPLLIAGAEAIGAFIAENAVATAVVGGTAIVGTGVAVGAAKFGDKAGDQAGLIIGIAAIGIIAFLILRKRGTA